MKLRELVSIESVLEEKLLNNKLLPLRIGRQFYPVCEELEQFQKSKDEGIKRYGEIDSKNGQYSIPPTSPNYITFIRELEEIMEMEVLKDFTPVNLTEVEADKGELTVGNLHTFKNLIKII